MQISNKIEGGFTLIEILVVIIGLTILASIILSPLVKFRQTTQLNAAMEDAVSLLAMAGILWWLHWGVIPVLMLAAIPYFLVRLQQSNRLFAWERERTPLERKGVPWKSGGIQPLDQLRMPSTGRPPESGSTT